MASFNANINLLAYKQSRICGGIDPKNPNRAFVCIPCDINEVKISDDGTRATSHINIWPLGNADALLRAINETRQRRGDAPLTLDQLHTHTLDVGFSDDHVKLAIKAYGKALIDKVLAAQKPDYAAKIQNDDPNDVNSGLFKAIRSYMQPRLANVYQHRRQPSAAPAPVAYQQVQGATAWTQPAESQDPFAMAMEQSEPGTDELPF